jgi:hypothetical protein
VLARAAPEAKLLVLVRDPVERFRSGLSFRLGQRVPHAEAVVTEAVRQGFYAQRLRRYLEYFGMDRIKVLQYEECVRDPAGQLVETYRFLGLREHRPKVLRNPINASGAKRPIDPDARARLAELYRGDVDILCSMVPSLDRSLWPNFTTSSAA